METEYETVEEIANESFKELKVKIVDITCIGNATLEFN